MDVFLGLAITVREPGDRDGDGLPDSYEVFFGLDPDFARDGEVDTDGDLLDNVEEFELGTSPLLRDTDDDGDPDGFEVERGTDPLTPEPPPDPGLRLDGRCIVAALNRTVPVDPDGTWILPGLPANRGPVRVRASCLTADGSVFSGQAQPVVIPPDGVVRAPEIVFEQPQPVPASLSVSAPRTVLTEEGEAVQLTVTATYPDGSTADVTPVSAGTGYTVTDPTLVAVSGDGTLTARASGVALVTAVNEGALGFLQVEVRLGGDSDGDGVPDEVELAVGLDPNNPFDVFGDLDGDGLTDREELVELGTDPLSVDTDGDGLEDGEEVSVGTDGFVTSALLADTDGDELRDGLEVATGSDPTDPTSFNLAAALERLEVAPEVFTLTFSTIGGESFRQLSVTGLLIDGTEIDLTARSRGTSYRSDDLSVCNFGAEDGRVFAGEEGSCVVTVDNAGFETKARVTVRGFAPALAAVVELPGLARDLDVAGDFVWVAADISGLFRVSVADRELPELVSRFETLGEAADVRLDGDLAWVADGSAGLTGVDVSDPTAPRLLGNLDTPGEARAVAVRGEQVVLADGPEGLRVIDVSDPLAPSELGAVALPGLARGVAVTADGSAAVVAAGPAGIHWVDLSDPTSPRLVGSLATGEAHDVGLAEGARAEGGTVALVADFEAGLLAVDGTDPATLRRLTALPRETGGLPVDLATVVGGPAGDLAFAAEVLFVNAVPIYDVTVPGSPSVRGLMDFSDIASDAGRGIAADTEHIYLAAGPEPEDAATARISRLYIGRYRALEDLGEIPPAVRVTAPEDGATVAEGERFVVEVQAADDVGVFEVDVLVDGEVVATDAASPFRAELTAPAAPAVLNVGAVARDFAGNEGRAEEIEVRVVGELQTTVVGSVIRDDDGRRVPGARVFTNLGGEGTTDEAGQFALPGVPAVEGPVRVFAAAEEGGESLRGASAPRLPVPEGVTDVGEVAVEPLGELFPGPRTTFGLSGLGTPRALLGADVDGDGREDAVALYRFGRPHVAVARGLGEGRFGVPFTLTLPQAPRTAAVADVGGDGRADLVLGVADGSFSTSFANGVYVARGLGDGTFEEGVQQVQGRTFELRTGDLDGDGRADVVARREDDSGNPTVEVFRSTGSGLTLTAAVPGLLRVFAVEDFDRDGRLDLLARVPGHLSVYPGNGDGTLSPERPLVLDATAAVTVDFNGDGSPDVAAVNFSTLSLQLGNGDGTFRDGGSQFAGARLSRLEVADLDLDGAPDLVGSTASGLDIYPFLNRGEGSLARLEPIAVGERASRFVLAEVQGDGLPDLVALDFTGLAVFRGRGDGGFDAFERLETNRRPAAVRLADLDRDGDLDLLYIEQRSFPTGLFVRLNDGAGGFDPPLRFPFDHVFSRSLAELEVLDVDGDGTVDAVTLGSPGTVRLLPGLGDGGFGEASSIETSGIRVDAIELADLDGDGLPDLAAVAEDELLVLTNRGGGVFASPSRLSLPERGRDLRLADATGDGRLDVLVLTLGGAVQMLPNTGQGFGSPVAVADAARARAFEVADVDRDGRPDLLRRLDGRFPEPNELEVLRGRGDGTFETVGRFPAPSGSPRPPVVADVDVDGFPDVVLPDTFESLSVLLGEGSGRFAPGQSFATDPDPWAVAVGDLDGDGRPEIVVGGNDPGLAGSRSLIVVSGQ